MLKLKPLIDAADFGDTRRNDRIFELIAALIAGNAVRSSTNAAWAHAMGSFRFYSNKAVTLVALYSLVISAVRALLPPKGRVFIAHDGSILDYSSHKAKRNRILVGNHRGKGYELYSALVLNEKGQTLGPIFQEVRTARGCYSSAPASKRAPHGCAKFVGHIEQMEKAVHIAQEHLPEYERVHLADREFDDVELQRGMFAGERPERYVVRAQHMRRKILHKGEHTSLKKASDSITLRRGCIVERKGVRYRKFSGETRVIFDGLSWRGRHRGQPAKSGPPIPVRVVVVELRAHGHETIRWVLLTNLNDSIGTIVEAYIFRWKIERYFYLTKVGLNLETWTQQKGEHLARRLAVSSLAAMVIDHLLSLKDDPDGDATLREIAVRGNWLGRKRDPIGPLVLMRGMLRILDSLIAIQQLGVAKIRQLSEQILPGITDEIRGSPKRKNV